MRLYEAKVPPLRILADAAAVTTLHFSSAQPGAKQWFYDDLHYQVTMGYRILLIPTTSQIQSGNGKWYVARISGPARKYVGQFLWHTLGGLLRNIAMTIIERPERERQRQEIFASELI
jgi:hypothetical protein